jgi:hypothetical protein
MEKQETNSGYQKFLKWLKESILYYWGVLIIIPSIKNAVPFSEIWEKLSETLIAFAISLIFILSGIIAKVDNLGLNLLTLAYWIGITFVIRVVWGFISLPSKLYNTQKRKLRN